MFQLRWVIALPLLTTVAACGESSKQLAGPTWGGFTLGEKAPARAVKDKGYNDPHRVELAASQGFPWQSAFAQLDDQYRVMSVTLTTSCCIVRTESDKPPSPEEAAANNAAEQAVPDRFREGKGPPSISEPRLPSPMFVNRVISGPDMINYGRAALRTTSARLGPPAKAGWESSWVPLYSSLNSGRVFRARWFRSIAGVRQTVAMLDIGKTQNCLTIVAEDIPHPLIQDGCRGLQLRR